MPPRKTDTTAITRTVRRRHRQPGGQTGAHPAQHAVVGGTTERPEGAAPGGRAGRIRPVRSGRPRW